MENRSLRLAESIFSLIENFDNVMHNNHIQFNKSYKTVVLFKLNNADFLPLFFPAFFKSFNLLFLCVYRTPLHIILFLIMSVYHLSIFLILLINFFLWFLMFYVVRFFRNKTQILSKLFMSDLAFNVSKTYNYHLVCNSAMLF